MSKRTSKKIDPRHYQLTGDARRGYTYFVIGSAAEGFRWQLVAPNDDLLCSSNVFARKADCLKTLRAAQRHAATTHIIDEATV